MPHSSKKYKRPQTSAGKGFSPKWYPVIGIIVVIVIVSSLYVVYPPFSSAFQSLLGSSSATTNTSTAAAGNLCSGNDSCVYAVIDTSQGTIELVLFQTMTPKTVSNFVSLAQSGFYNNLVWHRIVAGFVIQTGDPNTRNAGGSQSTWGSGGSPTSVPLEAVPSLHNDYGYVAMAHTESSTSANSQFYINIANNTSLDGQYTVFGKVIKGMNVALAIGSLPVNSQDIPLNPQQAMMISVTIQSSP